MGMLGDPAVWEMLDGSDCVIVICVVRTDLGTGFWTECINPKSRILIDPTNFLPPREPLASALPTSCVGPGGAAARRR